MSTRRRGFGEDAPPGPPSDFRARWPADRAPDLGKGCLRVRSAADLDHDLVAEIVSACSLESFVQIVTAGRATR